MDKNFRLDSFYARLRREHTQAFDFSRAGTAAEIFNMQIKAREKLRELLCIDKIPYKLDTPNVAPIEGVTDMGYCTRERVSMEICEGLIFPMYILRPKNMPKNKPIAVACHGHGYGSREAIGLDREGVSESTEESIYMRFASELCKLGYTVAVPDELNFGDTEFEPENIRGMTSCIYGSVNLMMLGLNTIGMRVYQLMKIIDYMLGAEKGDPASLTVMGLSGGGTLTSFGAAMDTRIQAAVVSGYLSTFADSIMNIHHCLCNYTYDIYSYFDMKDVAALIAPRYLFMEAGTRDPIFPVEAVKYCYAGLERLYGIMGCPEKLGIDVFEGEHRVSGAKSYDFLKKNVLKFM